MLLPNIKIDEATGCHIRTGQVDDAGYGILYVGNIPLPVHRVIYVLTRGPIPDRHHVMHSCDRPPCVNAAHLSVGTTQANTKDMVFKGRQARGEGNAWAKITECEALAIRQSTEPGLVLAARYGLAPGTISKIRSGRLWKHLEGRG